MTLPAQEHATRSSGRLPRQIRRLADSVYSACKIYIRRVALGAWTRQVDRRQVSSNTLAGGHVDIDMARSLRATAGSTGHRRCGHCRCTEKNHALPCRSLVKKIEDGGRSRAAALTTRVLMLSRRGQPSCQRASRQLPGKKMRPPHAPSSSHRPTGRCLGAALTGGCWHSGRYIRDVSDRPGGAPVASRGRIACATVAPLSVGSGCCRDPWGLHFSGDLLVTSSDPE